MLLLLRIRSTLSMTEEASAERADIAATASSSDDAAAAETRMFAAVVTPAAGQEQAACPWSRGRQHVSKSIMRLPSDGQAGLRRPCQSASRVI